MLSMNWSFAEASGFKLQGTIDDYFYKNGKYENVCFLIENGYEKTVFNWKYENCISFI